MKPNLENLKEYTKNIKLSQEEKFDMLQKLRTYSTNNPIKPSFYSMFFKQGFAYASIFAGLIVGMGATSITAESSLPGDLLYPIKTNINETVVRSLIISDTQKAKNSVNLVNKRAKEFERMIEKKTNTPENVNTIVTKLEEHIQSLQEFLKEVNPDNLATIKEQEKIIEIYLTLELILEKHTKLIEDSEQKENDSSQTPSDDSVDPAQKQNTDTIKKPDSDKVRDGTDELPDTQSSNTPQVETPEADMSQDTEASTDISQITSSEQSKSEITKKDAEFSVRLETLIESAKELIEIMDKTQ